jgi:hypothetical protein
MCKNGLSAPAIVLSCLALAAAGCGNDSPFGATTSAKWRPYSGKTAVVKNRYLAVTGKKNGGGDQLFLPQDLYAPFRIEATAGLLDAKHTNVGGATYEIQLFPFTMRGTPTSAGTTVTVLTDPGSVTIASLDFPQAAVLDFAIEYDDAKATFFARKEGDASYTTVTSVSVSGLSPLEANLEVDALKKGGVIGFDNLRVAQRGHRPGTLTSAQQAVDDLYGATDHLANALYAADGAGDRTYATSEVAAALPLMNSAATLLAGLSASDGRKLAMKRLAQALKNANAASTSLAGAKSLAAVEHQVGEALCETLKSSAAARFL